MNAKYCRTSKGLFFLFLQGWRFSLVFFLFFSVPLFSQKYEDDKNYLIDSVNLSLLTEQEKGILDSVIRIYKKTNPDSVRFSALSFFVEQCGNSEVWNRYNDFVLLQLESKIKTGRNSTKDFFALKKLLAGAYNNRGYFYGEKGNVDLQIYYYHKGLSLRMQVRDREGEAASLNNLGYAHKIKGEIKKAISYYAQSSEVFKSLRDTPGLALSRTNMGVLYENQGDIKNAVGCFDESLKLYELMKDEKGVSHAFYNLGSLYLSQKDYLKAREYFWKSLRLRQKVNYGIGVGFCYSNIGQTYQLEQKHDSSIYFFNLGLKCFRGEYKLGEANCLANIGNAYLHLKLHKEAIPYLDSAQKIQHEISFKQGLSSSLVNLARAFYMDGKIGLSKEKALSALKMSQELGYPNNIRDASKLLYEIAKEEGDFKTALTMNELYISMRDSISNIENEKITFRQQTKYEYEKAQSLKDARHETEVALLEAKKNEQKVITLVVAFFLALVLVLALIIYNRLKLVRAQKSTIESQKLEVEIAHQSLFEKNKEILDSINYAKRIQDAFLKREIKVGEGIPAHFVLFKPKDIVSGDFYWKAEKDGYLYLAVADCTGHGVPGALLTMIGTSFLNEIVSSEILYSPSEILNFLRDRIILELNQTGRVSETKDGMDISLVRIKLSESPSKEVMWAGANNPIYAVTAKSNFEFETSFKKEISSEVRCLYSLQADKMPIGYFENLKPFSNHVFHLNQGDMFYLFTDGFADQFGGPKGKKYKYSALKEKLFSFSELPLNLQLSNLEKEFENWKGSLEQVDDICLLGIKL